MLEVLCVSGLSTDTILVRDREGTTNVISNNQQPTFNVLLSFYDSYSLSQSGRSGPSRVFSRLR